MIARARKAARPSNEAQVQASILEWLATAVPGAEAVHITNNPRNAVAGAKSKRIGMRKGAPDLVIFLPGGRAVLVEVKDQGRVHEDQRAFGSLMTGLGFSWFVARSSDDTSRAFRSLGIPTREAA